MMKKMINSNLCNPHDEYLHLCILGCMFTRPYIYTYIYITQNSTNKQLNQQWISQLWINNHTHKNLWVSFINTIFSKVIELSYHGSRKWISNFIIWSAPTLTLNWLTAVWDWHISHIWHHQHEIKRRERLWWRRNSNPERPSLTRTLRYHRASLWLQLFIISIYRIVYTLMLNVLEVAVLLSPSIYPMAFSMIF